MNLFQSIESVTIKHIDIDWIIDFDAEILQGKAYYKLTVLDKPIDKIVNSRIMFHFIYSD